MDSEAASAAVHPSGTQNRDTDELLDPVLFSDNNDSFKLKTVPAFRCVFVCIYICMCMCSAGSRESCGRRNSKTQLTYLANNIPMFVSWFINSSIHLLISSIISLVGIGLAATWPEEKRCEAYFIMLYLRAAFWVITFVSIWCDCHDSIHQLLTYTKSLHRSLTTSWRSSMIIYAWMAIMTSIGRRTCKRAFPYRLSRCGTQCCWPSRRSYSIIMANSSWHIALQPVGYRPSAMWPYSMWPRAWYSLLPMVATLVRCGTEIYFKRVIIYVCFFFCYR